MVRAMRILGLAGSLRAQSIHREILRAMVRVVPSGMTIDVDDRIRALPLFNPDQEMAEILAVEAFRAALREADGVIIACPEYAHGVPGAFKNALDWVVASGEFIDKPFMQVSANARGDHARASVAETLITMNAHWVPEAAIQLALPNAPTSADAICADPTYVATLQLGLERLAKAIVAAEAIKAGGDVLPPPLLRPVFPIA